MKTSLFLILTILLAVTLTGCAQTVDERVLSTFVAATFEVLDISGTATQDITSVPIATLEI
ncbi:MAG: hypothetical protein E4G99_13540, partial [Anaerolineales bacterium]